MPHDCKRVRIFTIPNLLSLFRLILIPWIIWLYCVKQSYGWTIALVALSGFTDIVDGKIARKTGTVTDLGKVLDPIADKLTQGAVLLCLSSRYPWLWLLIGLFVAKEVTMGIFGIVTLKKTDTVNSAKWHGKACTVLLYGTMTLLILFPYLPTAVVYSLSAVCAVSIVFSFVMYCRFYISLWKEKRCIKSGKKRL